MRHVPDIERRARLGRRQAVAPAHRVADPLAAAEAVVALHATEPASVHLAVAARVDGVGPVDVEKALHDDRSVVKQLAMRRTLFGFPRDLLPAAWGSASARVASQQRALVAKDVVRHGITDDGEMWLAAARAAVLERLSDGGEVSARQLREELPALAGRTLANPEKKYAVAVPFAPRVLTLLGAEGRIVRGHNQGHWRLSRPGWTLMESWLGEVPPPLAEAEGYAELVRRWLSRFGPGTEADLVWWLGATKAAVRRALTDVSAVEVGLDDGGTGYLLPDDLDPVDPPDHWAALLPVLDPTVMGWQRREWYLGDHAQSLFDRNGNAGTTVWLDGRIVGCWVQDDAGAVRVHLLEEVPAAGARLIGAEAERLTDWLAGERVGTVYPSAAMKEARGGT